MGGLLVLPLVPLGLLGEDECATLERDWAVLARLRFGLHLVAPRREERLLFDHQKPLASLMGLRDEADNLADHFGRPGERVAVLVTTDVFDDRNGAPRYEALMDQFEPGLRRATVDRWGAAVTGILDRLSRVLTTEELQAMNRRVQDDEPIAAVAASWLRSVGLVDA